MTEALEVDTIPASARLHRRRQQVVVRAGNAPSTPPPADRRRRMPTLLGLAPREAADTLPEISVERATLPGDPPPLVGFAAPDDDDAELTPEPRSGVRVRIGAGPAEDVPPPPEASAAAAPALSGEPNVSAAPDGPLPGSPACMRRPEFLLDDVDAERARRYRAVADQLIACGIFEPVG